MNKTRIDLSVDVVAVKTDGPRGIESRMADFVCRLVESFRITYMVVNLNSEVGTV